MIELDVLRAVDVEHRAAGGAAEHEVLQLHMSDAVDPHDFVAEAERDDQLQLARIGLAAIRAIAEARQVGCAPGENGRGPSRD